MRKSAYWCCFYFVTSHSILGRENRFGKVLVRDGVIFELEGGKVLETRWRQKREKEPPTSGPAAAMPKQQNKTFARKNVWGCKNALSTKSNRLWLGHPISFMINIPEFFGCKVYNFDQFYGVVTGGRVWVKKGWFGDGLEGIVSFSAPRTRDFPSSLVPHPPG